MSGSKSIGEAGWKPHNCNVETNPYVTDVSSGSDSRGKYTTTSVPTFVQKEECNKKQYEIKQTQTGKQFEDIDPSLFEWTYYSDGSKHGKRCHINNEYIGNKETTDEIKLESVIGTRNKVKNWRGGVPGISPGDKNYSVPEFSSDFHKEGSTLPAVDFSRTNNVVTETFIPLQKVSSKLNESFSEKERERRNLDEVEEVRQLDKWSPSKPLAAPFSS